MIIAGAGGHATEVAELLLLSKEMDYFFYDPVNIAKTNIPGHKVLHSVAEINEIFKTDKRYILGTGDGKLRKKMADELDAMGGELQTIISSNASVSSNNVSLQPGLNIMQFVLISANVSIGKGCLINARANVHHDVLIGEYAEIGPGALLLGRSKVGSYTMIGAGAIILPGLAIGDNCSIGAGSVITKNIADGETIAGVPGRKLNK